MKTLVSVLFLFGGLSLVAYLGCIWLGSRTEVTREQGIHGIYQLEDGSLPPTGYGPNSAGSDQLDVIRPKVPRRPPPRISRTEQLMRRSLRGPSPFPEFRLGPDDGHTKNETAIDADGSVIVAAYHKFTDQGAVMGVSRSSDGGDSWGTELFADQGVVSDPMVKAAGGGIWYVGYLAVSGGDFDIFLRRSLDDGAAWSQPIAVTVNDGFDDKPYVDAIGDEVLVAYADFAFSPARIRAVRSLDAGQSFDNNRVLVTQPGEGGNGACPVIGPEGNYYVFWRASSQQFLRLARSFDRGASWEPEINIVNMNPLPSTQPEGFRIINVPSVAVDRQNGDLVLVWNDRRFGGADILSIRSEDAGATWSEPILVNDDGGGADQFFPWVDIDEAGGVHVVWYDRRHGAAGIDVYYAASTDGGLSFEPNRRITAQAFVPVLPWEGVSVDFIGDYIGIAASGNKVFPCYQDGREGIQNVYVSVLGQLSFADLLAQWPQVTLIELILAL